MSVHASAFLDSARAMIKSGAEINCRNCISRAYYATFHVARPLARKFGSSWSGDLQGGAHERVICRLEREGNPSAVQWIGAELRKLKGLRVEADYRLSAHVTRLKATSAVDAACQICELVDEISNGRTRVRGALKRRRKAKTEKRSHGR